MGLLDIFSKEKKLEDLRTPEQRQLGRDYLGSLSRGISGLTPGQAFPGDLNVGLSEPEQGSLGNLAKFANRSIGNNQAFQAGKGNILATLAGDRLNVAASPSFKAFQAELSRNKQQAIDDARRSSAVRRDFNSSGSARIESDIALDATNRANTLLADLFNRELDRQSQASQQALSLGQFENDEPLRIAQAQQTLGALPRLVEESNLSRAIGDFTRQRQEQLGALSAAGSASNEGQPLLGLSTYREPTALGSLVNAFAPAVGEALGQQSGNLLSNFFNQGQQPQGNAASSAVSNAPSLVSLLQLAGG